MVKKIKIWLEFTVGIGRTYRNLGQLNLVLQSYQLAETNYLLAKTYPYSQMANLFYQSR